MKKIICRLIVGSLLASNTANYGLPKTIGTLLHLAEISVGALLCINAITNPAQILTIKQRMIQRANENFDQFLDELFGDNNAKKTIAKAMGKDLYIKQFSRGCTIYAAVQSSLFGCGGLFCIWHGLSRIKKIHAPRHDHHAHHPSLMDA